jgi:hypothetical protein
MSKSDEQRKGRPSLVDPRVSSRLTSSGDLLARPCPERLADTAQNASGDQLQDSLNYFFVHLKNTHGPYARLKCGSRAGRRIGAV